jgi:hypothetical protein
MLPKHFFVILVNSVKGGTRICRPQAIPDAERCEFLEQFRIISLHRAILDNKTAQTDLSIDVHSEWGVGLGK